jgi:hypothetical protein
MSGRHRCRAGAGLGTAVGGLVAAAGARAAYSLLNRRAPGGTERWARVNHRGEPVTLLEGPAVAVGAIAGSLVAGSLADPAGLAGSAGLAMAVAGAGAAVCGGYDDLAGSGDRRGFRGHLGALLAGEVTTGTVKLGGIGATGLVSAALVGGPAVDVLINAGLIAGSANLLNLFDLRPGRAIKAGLLMGALGGGHAAAPVGAALALLPEDLRERAMLGDAGANALGAMLGSAAAAAMSRPARLLLLAGVMSLTAASEKVSFTKVIERTPALRYVDMLGRRPPAASASARTDSASARTDSASARTGEDGSPRAQAA